MPTHKGVADKGRAVPHARTSSMVDDRCNALVCAKAGGTRLFDDCTRRGKDQEKEVALERCKRNPFWDDVRLYFQETIWIQTQYASSFIHAQIAK